MDLDLENGDGGGGNNNDAVAVLRCPNPADPHKEELQPFTWLRAAPYIAATLASVALFAVSLVLVSRSCPAGAVADRGHHRPNNAAVTTQCFVSLVLLPIAMFVMAAVMGFTASSCAALDCRPRLEADR